MINLQLSRIALKETYTIGTLRIGTEYFCDTLEDAVRDFNKDGDLDDYGEMKVYGETAIPYGRYRVIVTWSPKFKRELPLILDVRHFTGIRIHRGNYPKDSAGCILVGENTKPGMVLNSAYYEKKLVLILKGFITSGEEIFINVV